MSPSSVNWARVSAFASVLGAIGTFLAPLFALQISAALERRRDVRRRQTDAFQLLMQWRATVYLEPPVRILNSIDVLFIEARSVREAWSDLYSAYNDRRLSTSEGSRIRQEKLEFRLEQIANHLGCKTRFSKADFERVYNPEVLAKHYKVLIAKGREEHRALSEASSPVSGQVNVSASQSTKQLTAAF